MAFGSSVHETTADHAFAIHICPVCEIVLSHFPFQQTTSQRTIPIPNTRRAFVPNLASPVKHGAHFTLVTNGSTLYFHLDALEWIIAFPLPVIDSVIFLNEYLYCTYNGFRYTCVSTRSHDVLSLRESAFKCEKYKQRHSFVIKFTTRNVKARRKRFVRDIPNCFV